MSPTRCTEFTDKGQDHQNSGLQVFFPASTSTIPEGDCEIFLLGTSGQEKIIDVTGSGHILVRNCITKKVLQRLYVDQRRSPLIIEDTKSGQKLELTYEPPINR
jgi:hypothetical protein